VYKYKHEQTAKRLEVKLRIAHKGSLRGLKPWIVQTSSLSKSPPLNFHYQTLKPVRIRVRIGLPHPLMCCKRQLKMMVRLDVLRPEKPRPMSQKV
jgi:hypothetical protein